MFAHAITRVALALVFGIYFGLVVFVNLVRTHMVPRSVQMLVVRAPSGLQTEVRLNGKPVYIAGVEGP